MDALIVGLVVTGAALLVVEAHVVSFGVLGAAGILALVLAAVLAVGEAGGGAVAALAVAIPIAAVAATLLAIATRKSLAVRRRRVEGGSEGLIGRIGTVRHAVAPEGDVFVSGELWHARHCVTDDDEDEPALVEGEKVVVERVQGLTLTVRRAEEWEVLP
jgi:membrane-bound ClpP family serine protease